MGEHVSHYDTFQEALARWDILHAQEAYSLPSHLGRVAIFAANYAVDEGDEIGIEDRETFEAEALSYVERFEAVQPDRSLYVPAITAESVSEVLMDESVNSMVFIGHGNFSAIQADDGTYIDWRFISGNTTHLKTGFLLQRFCGHYVRRVAVPFGLFAMAFPPRVLAPVGEFFGPEIYDEHERDKIIEEENKIRPIVAAKGRLEYDDILALFRRPRRPKIETAD
jgi:hypothetical protein